MDTTTALLIAIPVLVVFAGVVLFASARRRDTGEAIGALARETRKRDGNGIVPFPGRASAAFIEAMKARDFYFGASKLEADRDADDPKKIAALAFDVLDDFAAHWYERK